MNAQHPCLAAAAALVLLSLPAVALAAGPDAGAKEDTRTVVVVGERGETLSVDLEGSELTIVTRDGDASTVRIVDLAQVGLLVQDGLQETLAALRDLQLDVHMGRHNRLNVSHGDRTFEVDVDAVMAEVGAALEAGLGGLEGFSLDTADWTSTRDRDREMQDLRARLDELKDEVRRLRRELDAREP